MKIVLIAGLLIVLILFSIKFEVQQTLSTQTSELVSLQTQIKRYKIENMALQDRYLHDSAYTTLAGKARQEGFVPAQVIYLP